MLRGGVELAGAVHLRQGDGLGHLAAHPGDADRGGLDQPLRPRSPKRRPPRRWRPWGHRPRGPVGGAGSARLPSAREPGRSQQTAGDVARAAGAIGVHGDELAVLSPSADRSPISSWATE
jgi:hypothetical protein